MDIKELYITASLAKLELNKAEAEKLAGEVSRMLEYFSSMEKIDITSLEPTNYVLQKENRTRDDSESAPDTMTPEKILVQAPIRDDRFIVIPNVL